MFFRQWGVINIWRHLLCMCAGAGSPSWKRYYNIDTYPRCDWWYGVVVCFYNRGFRSHIWIELNWIGKLDITTSGYLKKNINMPMSFYSIQKFICFPNSLYTGILGFTIDFYRTFLYFLIKWIKFWIHFPHNLSSTDFVILIWYNTICLLERKLRKFTECESHRSYTCTIRLFSPWCACCF